MGNQESSTLQAGEKPKVIRRTNSAPSLMDMAKKHGMNIDEVVVQPMPEMEESATFSDLDNSKEILMDSSSKPRKSRPKRRPSFGCSFARRPSLGASFSRRPSFGNSAAMLDLSGRSGLSATQHTQNETNSDSTPPVSEEERRKKRRERRRRSNRPSSGTNGAEKPRRRSRSNTRLDTNTCSEKELFETGAFLETLMATPAGQAKLKEVMANKDVMQRISLAY